MAYLSLFAFFMLMLVTSNNLVQLFFGWEGWLGVYLLIDGTQQSACPLPSRLLWSTGSETLVSC